jgi:integrase
VHDSPPKTSNRASGRARGSIREHYGAYQVRVSAGTDPATGEWIILHETVSDEKAANRALTRLHAA